MKYKISGDNLQLVTLEIEPNEKMYAEAGALVYMSNNMNMEAKIRGGFLKGLGRTLAGETLFFLLSLIQLAVQDLFPLGVEHLEL